MSVAELIAELQKMPQDKTPYFVDNPRDGMVAFNSVKLAANGSYVIVE